jgi:hypothetical protein
MALTPALAKTVAKATFEELSSLAEDQSAMRLEIIITNIFEAITENAVVTVDNWAATQVPQSPAGMQIPTGTALGIIT